MTDAWMRECMRRSAEELQQAIQNEQLRKREAQGFIDEANEQKPPKRIWWKLVVDDGGIND